jgi:hypothetical protein
MAHSLEKVHFLYGLLGQWNTLMCLEVAVDQEVDAEKTVVADGGYLGPRVADAISSIPLQGLAVLGTTTVRDPGSLPPLSAVKDSTMPDKT